MRNHHLFHSSHFELLSSHIFVRLLGERCRHWCVGSRTSRLPFDLLYDVCLAVFADKTCEVSCPRLTLAPLASQRKNTKHGTARQGIVHRLRVNASPLSFFFPHQHRIISLAHRRRGTFYHQNAFGEEEAGKGR
jgi:hypothetical protein